MTGTILYLESSLPSNNKTFVNWVKFVSLTLSRISNYLVPQWRRLPSGSPSLSDRSESHVGPASFGVCASHSSPPPFLPTHPYYSSYTLLVFSFSL